MKIRNNSRILALVLALVMILPLISIPVFANEESSDAPAAGTASTILSQDFEAYKDKADTEALAKDTIFNTVSTVAYAKKENGNTFIEYAFGEANKNNPMKLETTALSYETTPFIIIEADYYVSAAAQGPIYSQFDTATTNGAAKNWMYVLCLDTKTNTVKIGNSVNASKKFEDDTWFNTKVLIDMVRGNFFFYLNGEFAGSAAMSAPNLVIPANSWIVSKTDTSKTFTSTGFLRYDNVKIYGGYEGIVSNPYEMTSLELDFENETVGEAPKNGLSIAASETIVSDTYGSKAWQISYDHSAGYNSDKNNKINNSAASYEFQDSVVLEADYFITPGSYGQIQCQLHNPTFNGSKVNNGFNDLYVINFKKDSVYLEREAVDRYGEPSIPMMRGLWYTVSLVLDLHTGEFDLYLNGNLVMETTTLPGGAPEADDNIAIGATGIILGKTNKAGTASTFLLDNIKFFEGDKISAEPAPEKTVNDFEEFVYMIDMKVQGLSVPALATYKKVEDNTVINLPLAGTKEDGAYVLLREDGKNIEAAGGITFSDTFEEDGTVTAKLSDGDEWELVLQPSYFYEGFYEAWAKDFRTEELYPLNDHEINSSKDADENYLNYYLVDANVADLAVGVGGQFGLATKIAHKEYSYATSDIVVFSADYFIEPGSKGVIEAQFEEFYYDVVTGEGEEALTSTETAKWMQMYYFDTETGKVEGTDDRMNIGAWNNIKYFLNLKTGDAEIYLNGALIATENVGKTNIIIGKNAASTFSFAKIQRTTSLTDEVAGNLMIDNVSVSTDVPADSQYGDGYLSDEAYLNNLSNILVTVKDPSFRFEDINGIRFATTINEEFLAGVLANLGEDAIVGMGTLIAPLDYVELAGAFTKEALAAIEVETAKYLDIPFEQFFEGAKGVDFGDAKAFTASIVDIKEANLMRDFAAVGYVTVKLPDGTERTYYAKSYATSNIVYEAKATLAPAAPYDYTEEEFAALTAFAEADVEDLIWVDVPYGSYNSPEFGEPSMNVEIEGRTFYSFWGEFATLTVTGPEGFKLYYNGEFIDSVDGKVVLENVAGDPEIGAIIIGLVDAGAYSVEGVAPLGTMENPIVIESLEDVVNVKVPENGLVYCQLVAGSTGYIVVTTESELASLYVYTENVQMNTLEGAGSVKIPVMTGETVMIQVSTVMDELTHTSPAGDVAFALATEAAASVTGPEMSVELAAGEWYILTDSAQKLAGMYLNIADTNLYYVIVNGEWYFDDEGVGHSILLAGDDFSMVTILFKNNTEEAFTVDLAFSATPLSADGEKIIAGEFGNGTPIALGEGSAVSYGEGHLSWTAEAAGTFTFEITSTENWVLSLTNQNTYVSTDMADYTNPGAVSVAVNAGDVVDIMVGAYDFGTVEYTFVASFVAAE